jgi:GNAT superfamily N-acetyltransferase
MKITTRDLGPELWDDLESLFGERGACGGCWCMHWRIAKGEKWEQVKGPVARARFRKLVTSGKAHGALAYVDGECVGWCAYGRRTDYDRLNRAPSLACDDAEEVWSLPCFYIKAGFRGKGVATVLLAAASRLAKRRGAKILEGYPVKQLKAGGEIPAAFAWTGTVPLFQKAGFERVSGKATGKQRMRKKP